MLEDSVLIWRFKHGSDDALRRIYEKYKNDLLALAVSLSNDVGVGEDAVHDAFVSLAEMGARLELRGNLKSYLSTCVANRVRRLNRVASRRMDGQNEAAVFRHDSKGPDEVAMAAEKLQRVGDALMQLPYEQREVILLRLHAGLTFRTIAKSQKISIHTVQSRYRYGLEKLQLILNSEADK
jgi:RNA polymerase sigma-70 factor (ECF subfamily)